MTKTVMPYPQRKKVQRELFIARQKLTHLVQMYQNGEWRTYYNEYAFVALVRRAREAVEYWTKEHDQLAAP